jgi:hypothetical protein
LRSPRRNELSSESKSQIASERAVELRKRAIDVNRVRLNLRQWPVSQVSKPSPRCEKVDIAATCSTHTMRAQRRSLSPAIELSNASPQIDHLGNKFGEIAMQILGTTGVGHSLGMNSRGCWRLSVSRLGYSAIWPRSIGL